ncbi:transglycosylase SLT domain-containing protein [Candidatus Micrarchaeota archaeon]|nr:transglycosylase SLT domain-containing protein [Candidatus Micrarchaeota archaeon]
MQTTRLLAASFILLVFLTSFSSAFLNELVIRLGYSVGVITPATPAETVSVKCAPSTVKTKDGRISGSLVDSAIEKAAAFYKIDPYAICAIIKKESNFDATALGRDSEVGLMQVLPSTIRSECGLDPSQLWDVNVNIRCGAKVFSKYCNLCGNNMFYCFCAYNAGPGNVGCGKSSARLICPVSSGKAKPYAYAKEASQNFNYFRNA